MFVNIFGVCPICMRYVIITLLHRYRFQCGKLSTFVKYYFGEVGIKISTLCMNR